MVCSEDDDHLILYSVGCDINKNRLLLLLDEYIDDRLRNSCMHGNARHYGFDLVKC
jgi:hypothetical protein